MVAKWILALAITAALGLGLVVAKEKPDAPAEKPAVKAEEKTVQADEKTAAKPEAKPSMKAGDQIILRMTGKVAVEMCRRMGHIKSNEADPTGLRLEMPATVAEVFRTKDVRVEVSLPIQGSQPMPKDAKGQKMVTLSAIVPADQFEQTVSPKGTAVYSSPGEAKRNVTPVLLAEESRQTVLPPSDMKQVKLRTWELTEEVGGVKGQTAR